MKHCDWHVLMRDQSFTCHPHVYPWVQWAMLPLLPSRKALSHFGWYSFPVWCRVGGWVGLCGLVKYRGVWPVRRRSLIQVLATTAGNYTCNHQVQCRPPDYRPSSPVPSSPLPWVTTRLPTIKSNALTNRLPTKSSAVTTTADRQVQCHQVHCREWPPQDCRPSSPVPSSPLPWVTTRLPTVKSSAVTT